MSRPARTGPGLFLALCLLAPAVSGLELQPPRYTREQMEASVADAKPFRFVYGTRDPAATATLRSRAYALALRSFGGDSSQVVADRDADEASLAASPVFLLGGPDQNEWTRRFAASLPVSFEARGFRWQGTLYDQPLDVIHLSWPNPLEPRRFLLLSAGNTPAALLQRTDLVLSEDDYRIVRDGQLVRGGRFAQDGASPWRYDAHRDRDREAERDRFARALQATGGARLEVRAPAGLALAANAAAEGDELLARMTREGLAAPAGAARPTLTLYRSLEEKGVLTFDTHAEHVDGRVASSAHAALPAGRGQLDLWSVSAMRLLAAGADRRSRFWRPAACVWALRFEGEPLDRALSRLYFAGLLPTAAEAVSRASADAGSAWRSPLVWTPARALLVRAVWRSAPERSRRDALLALLRADPPGTLDSVCAMAHLSAKAVERNYRELADSLARSARTRPGLGRREPWRPAQGFQRGVCLVHAQGVERGYLSAACAREMTRLRDAGADWVALTPFAWLPDLDPRAGSPLVLGNSTDAGPDGESDEAVCEAAARAHALGLRVWLKPHVWTRRWEGEMAFGPAGWRQFFAGYEELLLHWALLAEREGMDGLFVGHELSSSTAADPERWRTMIGRVRRAYTGTLSYCANWNEVARVPFWDTLDLVAVACDAPLSEQATREPGQLRAGATQALNALQAVARRSGRPVLLAELGYPATVNAAVRPWDGTPAAADPGLQRDCLAATVDAMDPHEWLAGALFWRWGSGPRAVNDVFDPRGQPAEEVLTHALKAWQGRPVRAPQASRESRH